MAKSIEQLRSGLVVGHVGLKSVGAVDPIAKDVHDGDTVAVVADGDFGVRFLGVDAPEVSTPLPGTDLPFVPLDDPRWEQALTAAFAAGAQRWGPHGDPTLVAHLKAQAAAGEAANHARLATTWARAALDRSEKLLTLCAPVDTDIASRAGSRLSALTPDDLRTTTTAQPVELLQRVLPESGHGLGILIRADAVIAATSRATHVEIETTLARLCGDHPVSVLCVYDRGHERRRERDGAGIEHLDLAVARHPDGLQEHRLALRRTADTLEVDGEIDMSNLDVFATALRALTDTPSPAVRIDLGGVTFLAAAGVRSLIRDTAPFRDRGAEVEIHATPHVTRILQLLDIHRLPQLHLSCRGVRATM